MRIFKTQKQTQNHYIPIKFRLKHQMTEVKPKHFHHFEAGDKRYQKEKSPARKKKHTTPSILIFFPNSKSALSRN